MLLLSSEYSKGETASEAALLQASRFQACSQLQRSIMRVEFVREQKSMFCDNPETCAFLYAQKCLEEGRRDEWGVGEGDEGDEK